MKDELRIVQETELSDAVLVRLAQLEGQIFEQPLGRAEILAELDGRMDLIILLAYRGEAACGYKIGYRHSPTTFYSWSGGVLPAYRKLGAASLLMEEQHRLAALCGYKVVRTQTRNRYRSMLLLNLKNGFDIIGTQLKTGDSDLIIVCEKRLELASAR